MKKILTILVSTALLLSFSTYALASTTVTVTKSVNFRSDPSTSSSVYSLLKAGTPLNVLAKVNSYWLKVQINGQVGYVSTNYVSTNQIGSPTSTPAPTPTPVTSQTKNLGAKIVQTAESFQGKVTYKFGVRDVSNLVFDCSSFTQYVFKLDGINIPWGSKSQSTIGTYVQKANLQPGDLVFFSVSTPNQINHVGIYIGNGQFINNLPNKGVIIADLNSSYWTSHYITARRVIS
jgi:cell wall-associated NlpC family hydrolase